MSERVSWEVRAMTHGESLAMAIEATQRALEQRLRDAMAPHQDPLRPRDNYAATDTFVASASRHLAATEAVLVAQVRHTVPGGRKLSHDYLVGARRLEHALARVKGKLYGEAHKIHLTWPSLWAAARQCLDEHNRMETGLVEALLRHTDTVTVDGLARRIFDAETRGPTRPHPWTPHTGPLGATARRMWALADRFWDDAEGRVIPAPVPPPARRHDSLVAQYFVADPRFDASASILAHRKRPLPEAG
jgi:hypothetical protein